MTLLLFIVLLYINNNRSVYSFDTYESNDDIVISCLYNHIYNNNNIEDDNSPFQQQNIILLPSYVLGLANKLRTISSFSIIAKELNRKLIIIWNKSRDCNANANELFSLLNDDDDEEEDNYYNNNSCVLLLLVYHLFLMQLSI